MNRRERLMATLRGEPVDRPAVNFHEIGGIRMDPNDPDPFNIYNDASWQPLITLAEEKTDLIRMRSAVREISHQAWDSTQRERGSLRDEFFSTKTYEENGCRVTRTTVRIGQRTLSSMTRRAPDVDTVWTVEPLLKTEDDLKVYLQLPDEVLVKNIDIDRLLREEKSLGNRGILMVDTEDPLCAAATLFAMENFVLMAATQQKLFHKLLEKCAKPIYAQTQEVSRRLPGRLWRIYGPEFACEPLLPPELFEEYVIGYTGPMVETIHEQGGFVRVHCHGKVRKVLDYIVQMGADAIDPLEPPPLGDVDLEFVQREYGEQLVLIGNIELRDIERMEAAEFRRLVETTLEVGAKGRGRGFVLMPSASPCGRRVADKVYRNYEIMVRLTSEFKL